MTMFEIRTTVFFQKIQYSAQLASSVAIFGGHGPLEQAEGEGLRVDEAAALLVAVENVGVAEEGAGGGDEVAVELGRASCRQQHGQARHCCSYTRGTVVFHTIIVLWHNVGTIQYYATSRLQPRCAHQSFQAYLHAAAAALGPSPYNCLPVR